jgi:16S rRNA (adenine1518-N6/adenine1519-N6)-dimethyltransferase
VARQKLGQHFLIKGSVLERIARATCPTPTDLVIEIGPGYGALTERLLKRAARVVAVELDPYLAGRLRAKFGDEERLEIVEGDVLKTDLGQWGRAPIAGNLPYYITSPILEKAARLEPPRAVFLIQKEVAARLAARPGSRDYGFLTVHTAAFADVRLLFEVKPGAFHPPPKVDSAVVLLGPRKEELAVGDRESFLRFAGHCFRHKRKTIRNNLSEFYGKEVDAWPEAGLRAEQISLEGLADMYRRLPPGATGQAANGLRNGPDSGRGRHE